MAYAFRFSSLRAGGIMASSSFQVIPAIDLMGGKCVRLLRGEETSKTVYSTEPVEMAKRWASEGAERLHVVDLDGAFQGEPKNLEVVRRICAAVTIPVQFGGGIRALDSARAVFDVGVERIIVSTRALRDLDFLRTLLALFPGKICVGIDARDGKVATLGWRKTENMDAITFASYLSPFDIGTIIYTDIKRDGTLTGPNLTALVELADKVSTNIIASGGIGDINHIVSILRLRRKNVVGVIVGKALYTRNVKLPDAIKLIIKYSESSWRY
jgi:phosphoribosylformimino-5-aminoimidazole carboxamide ribotide isomerase